MEKVNINSVEETIKNINNLSFESITSKEDIPYNEDEKNFLKKVFKRIDEISQNIGFLYERDQNYVNQLNSQLSNIRNYLSELNNLTIETYSKKTSTLSNIKNKMEVLTHNNFNDLDIFIMKKRPEYKSFFTKEEEEELNREVEKAKKYIKNIKSSHQEINKIKNEESISRFGNIFQKEAENYSKEAESVLSFKGLPFEYINKFKFFNLFIYILTFLVLILLSVNSIFLFTNNEIDSGFLKSIDTSKNFIIISFNIFILFLFFYILNFNLKKYNSFLHLSKIYKYKQNCLEIFDKLETYSDDVNLKNIILLQGTKTIFETPETGLLKVEKKNNGEVDLNILVQKLLKKDN